MTDPLACVRSLFPGTEVKLAEALRGGERSDVTRVRVRRDGQDEETVIVKTFLTAGESWTREAAALSVVPDSAPVPRLLAESPEPQVVVTSDVGTGSSVADRLIGDDAQAAGEAVSRWAVAVGRLHADTRGCGETFRSALDARAGDLPVASHAMPGVLADAAAVLDERCAALGVEVPSGAVDELRGLAQRLPDHEHAALSPHDTCPDNNVGRVDGLVLVDFEGAEWRHVAWDVAYLTVPWPSCWCSWRLPDDVAARALERYRRAVEDVLPYVRTEDFDRDVAAAATGWTFVSTAWFLSRALSDDPPHDDPRRPTPTRRAMILHRLGGARECPELPALAELANRLRDGLVRRWGEQPLELAPAFRNGDPRG